MSNMLSIERRRYVIAGFAAMYRCLDEVGFVSSSVERRSVPLELFFIAAPVHKSTMTGMRVANGRDSFCFLVCT